MKKHIIILTTALISVFQQLVANERWEVYNSYRTYTQIEDFHDQLFVRSGTSIFVTDIDGVNTDNFNKVDGLSSSTVQFIAKCENADLLAFVHNDGVIDVMDANGNFDFIFDLKNKSVVGDKTIKNVTICDDKLYLACGFGFVEADLSRLLITRYHFTNRECKYAFSYKDGIYYALPEGGLWRCDINKNLSMESNWKKIADELILDVTSFGKGNDMQCWVLDENKVIHILNPDGSYQTSSKRPFYEQLKHSGKYVFSKGWGFDMISTEDLQITYFQQEPYSKCVDYVAINDSTLFVVHPEMGLMKLTIGFNNWSYADIKQQSTPNNYFEIAGSQINELAYGHGILAATSGYKMYNNGYTDMYLANASINYFENEEWHHISERDILKMPLAGKEFRGITNVACDPSTPHRFYVSTLTTGLYQFDKDSLTQHFLPKTNIKSVHVDDDGILWVAKSLNDSTIWSYDPSSNEWTYHNISDFSQVSNVGRLFRQKYEQHRLIWAVNNYPYRKSRIGILYNTTAIKGNTKDDQSAHFTTFQDQDGNQYSLATTINTVYDIQEDREGKIWLLTNIGPFVVDDVTEAFNYAQQNPGIGLVKRIKVPRNDGTNLADYLLSTTACTAMVTDKENRKWIGTLGDGIYLITSDGLKEVAHYTTSNSPLLSDDITALAYDEENRQLFIASDGGVVIYHADDVTPAESFSDIHCYPNPLRPDYFGDIEIVGLMKDSDVSVTDVAGNLVWKTYTNDGFATWDGRGNDGKRVTPGVYIIHGVSESGSKGKTCKLLVL